ncbi:MAG: hypothetical protein U1F87_09760 [Kiritimatiellia bacterium]
MKSVSCKPRNELAEPALWLAGFALLFLYVGASNSSLASLHLAVGLICLLLAAGVWQELRVAVVTAAVLCAFAAINFSVRTVLDYSWLRMISAGTSAWLAYRFITSLRRWNEDHVSQESSDPEADKPMISIVLLLSRPKALDATILSHVVQAAWGGDYTSGDEEKQDGFVVGDSPVFLLKSKLGMFLLHNRSSPIGTMRPPPPVTSPNCGCAMRFSIIPPGFRSTSSPPTTTPFRARPFIQPSFA